MKNIILINTPTIPCPGSHYFTSSKFCRGFKYNGLNFLELNKIDDSISQYNTRDNIFLISNHFISYGGIDDIYKLGQLLPDAYFICWHFNFEKQLINDMPFKKFVITGEHYFNTPTSSDRHIEAHNFAKSCKEWEPFIFSSDINPEQVGLFTRNIIYDSCFIGYPYKSEWTSSLSNSYVFNSNGFFMPEENRISIYLSSRVCLGFHSDANIANSLKSQQEGYEFIKQKGTYYHLSQNFINKLKYLYE